jgi:hypothetical protein
VTSLTGFREHLIDHNRNSIINHHRGAVVVVAMLLLATVASPRIYLWSGPFIKATDSFTWNSYYHLKNSVASSIQPAIGFAAQPTRNGILEKLAALPFGFGRQDSALSQLCRW